MLGCDRQFLEARSPGPSERVGERLASRHESFEKDGALFNRHGALQYVCRCAVSSGRWGRCWVSL
jgi:hypothetical protein